MHNRFNKRGAPKSHVQILTKILCVNLLLLLFYLLPLRCFIFNEVVYIDVTVSCRSIHIPLRNEVDLQKTVKTMSTHLADVSVLFIKEYFVMFLSVCCFAPRLSIRLQTIADSYLSDRIFNNRTN